MCHARTCQQPSNLYYLYMKVTFDLEPDLYRSLKVEAARADRSVRDIVTDAIASWLERREADEDRASAAEALAEYRRDGGTSAAAFFEVLAAETRTEYRSDT
jgi:predicted transcriptional regulator